MAQYKYSNDVERTDSKRFDENFGPGDLVGITGIYKCLGCHHPFALTEGAKFPGSPHQGHKLGTIEKYRMVVSAGFISDQQ